MQLQDIYTRVQGDIGDDGGIFIRQEHVTAWVNSAIKDIYSKSEFGRSDFLDYTLAADQKYWSPQAEYASTAPQLRKIHNITIDGINLVETTPQELANVYYAGSDIWTITGMPRFYWRENFIERDSNADITGDAMTVAVRLWPINDVERTVYISHTLNPAKLTVETQDTDALVPSHFEEDIILYCVAKAHEKNKDFEASVEIMGQYATRKSERYDEAHELDDDFSYFSPDPLDTEGYEFT